MIDLNAITLASSLMLAAVLVNPGGAAGGEMAPSNESWGRVLDLHHHQGGLDYAALRADRSELDSYLAFLARARPERWTREHKIAFWCNAYNAVVAHLVVQRFPELSSVREVSGFFDELRTLVAGREMTLDEIETEARELGDPRVHFAVVCASTSCPDLRGEPYHGDIVDRQLEEDTRRFLADDSKGLRWEPQRETLYLSSIFKWYAGDFTGGSTVVAFFARSKVLAWILPHLPTELAAELRRSDPTIRYMDYDWSLNHRPRP